MLLRLSYFTTCFSSSCFFFFFGCLPCFKAFKQFATLIFIYMLISLVFMLLAIIFYLHFLFMISSSIRDLEKFLPNYEFGRFNLGDDLPSSLRSIRLSFLSEYFHPFEESRRLGFYWDDLHPLGNLIIFYWNDVYLFKESYRLSLG